MPLDVVIAFKVEESGVSRQLLIIYPFRFIHENHTPPFWTIALSP